jgi:hypothetical protein
VDRLREITAIQRAAGIAMNNEHAAGRHTVRRNLPPDDFTIQIPPRKKMLLRGQTFGRRDA